MKKFLTVLLALSVVFTYTVGSAFAANPASYTKDDYKTAFTNEWTNSYSGKLSSAAWDYAQIFNFSEDRVLYSNPTTGVKVTAKDLGLKVSSLTATGNEPWTSEAITEVQKIIEANVKTAVQKYTEDVIAKEFSNAAESTTNSPSAYSIGNAEVYTGITVSGIIGNYYTAVNTAENISNLWKAQAESVYAAVDKTVKNVQLEDYTAENAAIISKAQVETAKKVAEIKADTTKSDQQKYEAYRNTFAESFKAVLDKTPTKSDTDYEDADTEAAIAAAVADFINYGLDTTTNGVYGNAKLIANAPVNQYIKGAGQYIYEAGSGKSATIFGVKVANVDNVTLTEATAVNRAMRAAVEDAGEVITVYANSVNGNNAAKVAAVKKLYTNAQGQLSLGTFLISLNKTIEAVNVYADVVDEGEAMKAAYMYGVKVYNDANVDAAVKEAEALVYADLGKTAFGTEAYYITAAAAKLGITLEAENFEYQAFVKAMAAAKAKFFKADDTPQIKVLTGDNKTPEEDFVYLKSTYATCEAAAWTLIANDAVDAIDNAETYADIEAALADAKADLGELMLAKDEITVKAEIAKHVAALADDQKAAEDKMGLKDYIQKSYDDAFAAGKELIEDADTVDEVKAAYDQAVAIFKTIPTKAELEAAHDAVYKQIAALPENAKLTAADQETVVAAMDAYLAYDAMYGSNAAGIYNRDALDRALDTVLKLASKELQAKVDDMVAAIAKNKEYTDNGAAALVAMKADIKALIDEADAFNALLEKADDVKGYPDLKATAYEIDDVDALEAALKSEAKVWMAELHNLLVMANTANTAAEKKAVLDAYEKLTDRQKYMMEQNLKTLIEEIKADIIGSAKSVKIVTSTKLYTKSNKIRVNWTVKEGDTSYITGYQVYKSTKAHTNYKFMGKTTKNYMDNKKNLKKGQRFYYKVRAYVDVDGERYYSDWSNKGNRIYK